MFEKDKIVYSSLPAVPVRGMVALPNNEFKIEVGRDFSKDAITEVEQNYDNYCLLIFQKNLNATIPLEEDLLKCGVVAKLTMKIKLGNGNFKVKFEPVIRAKILQIQSIDPYFLVDFETVPAIQENIDEEMTLIKMVVSKTLESNGAFLNDPKRIIDEITHGVSSDRLADLISFNFKMAENLKFKYVENASINARLTYILQDIERDRYQQEIEGKINQNIKESIDENQKEYILREKMRAIQEELGDKAKKDSDIDKLRQAILDKHMPKSTEDKALYELSRYESTPAASGESGVIRSYLDVLIELPWNEETNDENDIKKAIAKLDETHFGLEKVKERIIEYLSVKLLTNKNPQTILCLVGPPGVGKTTLAISIAQALNRNFVKQSLGGIKDEAEIRGHRRTYLGALPGRIINGMRKAKSINPVFLLDEIDKLGSDYKGDPSAALLEVLDPEQNKNFSDHYLEEPYDLSKVLFIATANYLENVPAPLRDRMEIIELSSYTEIEKFHIAKEHLVEKEKEYNGLPSEKLVITDEALMSMIKFYTREAGVRSLGRLIGKIVRKAITKVLGEKKEIITITNENLESFLGKRRFTNNEAFKTDQIGVVTGLAYTEFGGDTLPVEVTFYKGKGRLTLTGKLGDVMKESAQAALSYVKTNSSRLNIDINMFEEIDVHIHVPEGAVPKDGPSAGVTITTALVSALTNKAVDHQLGMTGEVTLRGRVLPIGGLREKSIAALRSGLKRILIPRDNLRDLDEIPQEVKNALEIIPVDTIDDVLKEAIHA